MAKLYVVCDVPQQYVCVMGAEEYDAIDSAQRPRIHGEYETLTEAVAECDHVNAAARQQAHEDEKWAIMASSGCFLSDRGGKKA